MSCLPRFIYYKGLLFFLLCYFPFSRQYGQSNEYLFSHLDVASGLSNNHITSLYKDTRGFMWFGTMSGLNRYDGYEFKIFKHDGKDAHSIRDNYIEQIFEGPEGKMWVESRAGRFNIYDFARDEFDPDYLGYLRKLSLPESWLLRIVRGKTGFWFVYRENGIFHYGPDGKIVALHPGSGPGDIDPSIIADAKEDGDGNLWLVHQNGMLEKINSRQNKIIFRTSILAKEFGNNSIPCTLYIDRQNDCWICSNGVFKGAFYYNPATGMLKHLSQDAAKGRLTSNVVYTALQDEKGMIWLATDHGGIDLLDKKDFSVTTIVHAEDDRKSLAENSVPALYWDSSGIIWLGTFKSGISYYSPNTIQFPQYRHQPFKRGGLPYDDLNSFAEDAAGNIWIGSNGGGLLYFDRKKNTFRQYLHDPNEPNSLCNNIVVSLLVDKDNKCWIGTYFGGLDCYDGKNFTHYRHNDHQPSSLADDRVMCIYEDPERALWIGTLGEGMDKFDRRTNSFIHYNSTQPNSIHHNYVSSIIGDAQNNLWIATGYGIDRMDRSSGRFIHYSSDSNQLSSDNVSLLFRDNHQNIWAATREGLNVLVPGKKNFQSFSTADGLPDNTIRSILEDNRQQLWVSTTNGLSKITLSYPKTYPGIHIRCKNYHEPDGLQGREFNERTALSTRDGYMLFGGPYGFNIFRPENIIPTRNAPPIVLTGLEIFNKSVQVGEKTRGHVILHKALPETSEITLNYSDNIFSIEFASLGYINNTRNRYAYTLEGFNKNWLVTDGKTRKATFTNLDAGEYTFKVKASDEDGEWYEQQATLKIIVRPPFWKTPLAYILYIILLVCILFIARRMVIKRAKMRFSLEQERRETSRMHEMDLMKIRFFTNMSHELRTPLSLILAPVEKLLRNPPPSDPQTRLPPVDTRTSHPVTDPKKQYEVIRRNAKRLLYLVNQLLDFRKMEVNELKLHTRQGDVLKFVKDISYSFIDLAETKNISFAFHSREESLTTLFDPDKMERILFNLLSNAFKFTPENGAVQVDVLTGKKEKGMVMLQIKVSDTGIGIAPEKKERIFERFFQSEVPDTILNQGSGIGLAITQEFVKMHNGTLTVESELNKGSCFIVSLPFKEIPLSEAGSIAADTLSDDQLFLPEEMDAFRQERQEADTLTEELTDIDPHDTTLPPTGYAKDALKSTILIVEDNEDFRFYLKDNLRTWYTILESADGKEGWRKALGLHPDLVVSDVSMPVMNGIQLCRKIKADERTRHLPVILLTAMASESNELEGLQTGAADYITKPFNFEMLLSKIRNILAYNENIKKTYQRQVQASPIAVEAESGDTAFLQEVLQLIEKNMSNPDFSVEEMSLKFHASRSTFYKRLLLLTGKTPVEFIRFIRLKRAAELLEKSQMTISEIAYTVGFNNPKYFTQNFKTQFGMIPSAYRAQKK